MPVTLHRLLTFNAWDEFFAQTTSNEVVEMVSIPIREGETFIFHLFLVVKTVTGSSAAFYAAEALYRREVGGDVTLVADPSGHQTSDGDFTPQNPDIEFTVDTMAQTAVVNVEGLEDTPLHWTAQVLITRRL